MRTFVIISLIILYLTEIRAVCNTGAFTKVTVKAYFESESLVNTYYNIDLQALGDYYRLDVINANVSGVLCSRIIVNFPGLTQLTLINANITDIEINAIDDVPNLKMLSLSLNKLSSVRRGHFSNIPVLEKLYLSSNQIEYVEENAFNDMLRLKMVYLDRNRIQEMNGNWFLNSPQIKLVDLSHNRIPYVPSEAFRNLHVSHDGLVVYWLKYNDIRYVSDDALSFNISLVLHLENNQISEITESVLNNLQFASAIYLNKNDLSCETYKLLDRFFEKNATTDVYYDKLGMPNKCEIIKFIDSYRL